MRRANVKLGFLVVGICMMWSVVESKVSAQEMETVPMAEQMEVVQEVVESYVAEMEDGSTYSYTLNEAGDATITGYEGKISELVIPDALDGHPVVVIGDRAFEYCDYLLKVVISDSIIEIGESAFWACKNLIDISLPRTLEILGNHAFGACEKIAIIEIPKTLKGVDEESGPFRYCDNLHTVIFEEGITEIPCGLFEGTGLIEIKVPEGVLKIGDNAFSECTKLKDVKLPETLFQIGEGAFQVCHSLEFIDIPDNVVKIGTLAFQGCNNLKSVKLSQSIEEMGDGIFAGCSSLASIEIPESLNRVGYFPFEGCVNLKKVAFEKGTKTIEDIFSKCESITYVEIPDSVMVIGDFAFNGCTGLTSIDIPESVTVISVAAFYGCTGLTNVEIPDSVTTIDGSAFYGCAGLTDLKIPGSVMEIGGNAFSGCSGLTRVEISEGVISIQYGAFSSCDNLTEVILPQTVISIPILAEEHDLLKEVFSNPSQLTIYGLSDTYAETYAEEIGATFVSTGPRREIPATGVKDFSGNLLLNKGNSHTFEMNPVYTTDIMTWTSSNPLVVSVDKDGWVYAREMGTSTITVTTSSGFTDSCTITVIAPEGTNPFSDVDENSWQYPYVKFALENGLMTGKGTDASGYIIFDPNVSMTRAEFVQVLYSKEGKPDVEYKNTFTDVKETDWFAKAVIWANNNGIVAGKGEAFDVSGDITREQMAAILYKYAEYKGYETEGRKELTGFTDVDTISSWAVERMQWALNYGVMSGKGEVIDPLASASRAEGATMLKSFINAFE